MFPGGMNPKQMQGMMRQMGIKTTPINAKEVIIRTDGKEIIVKNPQVTEVDMKGMKTYQVMGDIEERERQVFDEEDIEMVMQQTGKGRSDAEAALKKHDGDIAAAILELQE
ncbi:MAG: nascent polypeptide-associated complex protein [Candidatus Diapherotrites archaeon]|nr:nascent polypeptide-associated complex protein [Candidatus Diapherotrites archaeon]